jgi:hypothetical protein
MAKNFNDDSRFLDHCDHRSLWLVKELQRIRSEDFSVPDA